MVRDGVAAGGAAGARPWVQASGTCATACGAWARLQAGRWRWADGNALRASAREVQSAGARSSRVVCRGDGHIPGRGVQSCVPLALGRRLRRAGGGRGGARRV